MKEKQSSRLYHFYKPLKDSTFLTGEAGSFSDVPKRTVQYWTEKGLITPEIADTTGTGSKRLYSVFNCFEIAIIKSLTRSRLSLKFIKKVMDFLREDAVKDDQRFGSYLETSLIWDYAHLIVAIDDSDEEEIEFGFSGGFKAGDRELYEDPKFGRMFYIAIKDSDKMITINLLHIAKKVLGAMS